MGRPALLQQTDVIERVLPLFWEQGYAATAIQDMVVASGQGRSSLYHAFQGKEGLYAACIAHYVETVEEPLLGPFSRGTMPTDALFATVSDFIRDTSHPTGSFILKAQSEQAVVPPAIRNLIWEAQSQRLNWIEQGINATYPNVPNKYRFELRTLVECYLATAYTLTDANVPNAISIDSVQRAILTAIEGVLASAASDRTSSNFSRRRR